MTSRVEAAGLPGFAWDPDWRLAWISSAFKGLLEDFDDAQLGLGQHLFAVDQLPAWAVLTPESHRGWLADHVSLMLDAAGGDPKKLRTELEATSPDPQYRHEVSEIVEQALRDAAPSVPVRSSSLEFSRWGEFAYVTSVLREADGTPIGTVLVGAPDLPVTLLVLLLRGDREMFDRMARLQEPSQREAALLFVDLQDSGVLSRHMPSAGYFRLIRELITRIDTTVARAGGVVGKHAGDGASGFFLADELGSASAAAAATIEAARSLHAIGPRVAREVPLDPDAVALNIGAHWGGILYIGQLTGGRLEVTALGDEVNECARIQEAARDGAVLVTKDLLERLDEQDARRLEIDVGRLTYRTVSEFEDVPEKVRRDAGTLSVAAL